MSRISEVERNTKETQIKVEFDIDGQGTLKGNTGIGFFDHMLELLVKHGNFLIYTKILKYLLLL